MIGLLNEHERTMAFAEVALGQIKSLRQTAVPRNYEIWYVYATGYNPALNKIINETLARAGKLSETDLEQIYDTYLSQLRASDRIDKVGSRVVNEIDDVMTLINEALASTSSYGQSLAGATDKLATANDSASVRAVVDSLIKSTREMQDQNRSLEARLATSKVEINNLQHSLEAIRAESLTDPLTSLGNRKYFDRALLEAVRNARERSEPLSLIMFDIDYFKSFNDNYGHLTGDQVLRLVAMSLKQNIKGQDITARYGGEEFAVVLPEHGAAAGAHRRRPHPPRRDVEGTEEEVDRRDPRPGDDIGRRLDAVVIGRRRHADRARRRLPLRRQAKRPQPRHLRSRSGVLRRDADPGGLGASLRDALSLCSGL